jgi:hypothetical protein
METDLADTNMVSAQTEQVQKITTADRCCAANKWDRLLFQQNYNTRAD